MLSKCSKHKKFSIFSSICLCSGETLRAFETFRTLMLSVWWDFKGIVYFELLPKNQTIKSNVHPKSKVRATIVELTVNWIHLYWAINDVRCDWITEHLWLNHGCSLKHRTYGALIMRCCWCFWEIIFSIFNALVLDHVTY